VKLWERREKKAEARVGKINEDAETERAGWGEEGSHNKIGSIKLGKPLLNGFGKTRVVTLKNNGGEN